MRDLCLSIPNNVCSIIYNAAVTDIVNHDSETPSYVELTWRNTQSKISQSDKYDSIIIATTAVAANIINFRERGQFIEKYRALRQVHYDCGTKIALFFNESWWYKVDTIKGGRSTTDLPVHCVYYHNFNVSALPTDGAAILCPYVWAQDSLLWQSLPDDVAIDLALSNLNLLHKETNVYNYFIGGIIKHWCDDDYSHGAFPLFTSFQEGDIRETLQKSINNRIYFIGDYVSSAHGSIEGAILSALSGVMTIQEESFDVIIVGGGPIGLLTAIGLASKNPNITIAILEQYQINNQYGSSHENVKQFRQPHSEVYLTELAKISIPLWRQLDWRSIS